MIPMENGSASDMRKRRYIFTYIREDETMKRLWTMLVALVLLFSVTAAHAAV